MPDTRPLLEPGEGLTEARVALPDGRRLRVVRGGASTGPLVVFEAGMTAPAASWVHTQRAISTAARTLSYDRAGYGGSDPDSGPRTLERLVDDLAALLDALGETDPVVLVGHSWGGPILRLFAARHPDRVAGLVFVDATLVQGMPARNARAAARLFRLMAAVVRCGGGKLVERTSLPHGWSPEISDADLQIIRRDAFCSQALRAGALEAVHISSALPLLAQLQAEGTPPVPTVCLQGGRVDRGMARIRPALNAEALRLMDAVPHGSVVVVQDAGHLIPQERPGEVQQAILGVLHQVREVQR